MRKAQISMGLLILAGVAVGGCTAPTFQRRRHAVANDDAAPPPMAAPAAPTVTPPAAKDLTHVLTKDEPFFASEPAAGAPPAGTLKAGSKVLMVIPGAMYSQVITDTGMSAYTLTDGLKPWGSDLRSRQRKSGCVDLPPSGNRRRGDLFRRKVVLMKLALARKPVIRPFSASRCSCAVSCCRSSLAFAMSAGGAAETAQPIPPEIVAAIKQLKTADPDGRQKIYDLLAAKGDARLNPALRAYKDGSLLLRDDRLMLFGERETVKDKGSVLPLLDALTGQKIIGPDGEPIYYSRRPIFPKRSGRPPRPRRRRRSLT